MARLYAAAFADDPGLADDLQSGRRYCLPVFRGTGWLRCRARMVRG